MKIAIIGTVGVPATYGGFETLVENLIEDDTAYFTVYCSGQHYSERKPVYKNAALIYIPLSANGVQSIIYDIWSILHALSSGHKHLLILGTSGAVVLPLVRLFCPSVNIVVNIDGLEWNRQKWKGFAKQFLKFSERLAVKFSSVVVADNAAIAKHIQSNYNAVCETIAYGGDHALIDKTLVPTAETAIGKEAYAFALCRIEPENNVHVILDAFSSAKMNLIFVGNWQSSDYGRSLVELHSSNSNINLLDPIYDLHTLALYRAHCNVYVHGHSAGGTNPSLVEMMHFDKPIVAFDCVYNRATMEDKGVYFSSASSLSQILDVSNFGNDGSELGDIARRRYTWSVVRAQYLKLFDFK
jgi:glycosyltransferase involved in cell wall biosynthesis